MTTDNITQKKDDDLFVVSTPDRTVSFLPDIPSIAIHTHTLIDGIHPFTEDCELTGDTRYCTGYVRSGMDLVERWTNSGLNDQVVWDELRRWVADDGAVRAAIAEENQYRRDLAKAHGR